MIVFPICKINLGLRVRSKRADGYHDLETIFFPVGLTDALELIPAQHSETPVTLSHSGLPVNGIEEDNLCIKAYHLLKHRFPHIPPIKLHLHKVIPMGAGLGGGSSDGAAMLQLLNQYFSLHLTRDELIEMALTLGSDCPFFLYHVPCYATGRGEQLEPIELSLANYHIALVNPGIHVSTGDAFRELNRTSQPLSYSKTLKEIIRLPVSSWKENIFNEFEEPVIQRHPEIDTIKKTLYDAGAVYASMSGSGSTVFGLFEQVNNVTLSFPDSYFVRMIDATMDRK